MSSSAGAASIAASAATPRSRAGWPPRLQHFYAQAAEPLSIDEIQLGLIEITGNRKARPARRRGRRCRPARARATCTAARRTR
jgi:hypothetical protein